MNDLEMLRAQLLGIRAQTDAALQSVNALLEAVQREAEAETAEARPRPRYLGDTPTPEP